MIAIVRAPRLVIRKINPCASVYFSDLNRKEGDGSQPKSGIIKTIAQNPSRALIVGGSLVVTAGVTRLFYDLTYSLMNLTPAGSLYYGFLGGILATGATAGMVYLGERSFRIHPYRAMRLAMQSLQKNQELNEVFGKNLTPSKIQSYSSTTGGFGMHNGRPKWFHPQVQLVFVVQGSKSEGLVTAVYSKKGLIGEELEYVGVDWMNNNEMVTLTIVGNSKAFTERSSMKAHGAYLYKKSNY